MQVKVCMTNGDTYTVENFDESTVMDMIETWQDGEAVYMHLQMDDSIAYLAWAHVTAVEVGP